MFIMPSKIHRVEFGYFITTLICITPWLSRIQVVFFGYNLRIESILGIFVLGMLLINPSRITKFKSFPSVFAPNNYIQRYVGLWLLAQVPISVYFSPNVGQSLNLVIWMFLNFCNFLWLYKYSSIQSIINISMRIAALQVILGILLFMLAQVSGIEIGVQHDPTYGGLAVYVATIEANVYAGLITIWSLVSFTRYRMVAGKLTFLTLRYLTPFAILASQTRTALLAWTVAAVALYLAKSKKYISFSYFAVTILVVIIAIGRNVRIPSYFSKFNYLLDLNQGNGLYRALARSVAVSDLNQLKGWLTGLGFNSFGQRHLDPTLNGVPWYLGDVTLQIVYGGGLISFLILFSLAWRIGTTLKSYTAFTLFLAWYLLSTSTSVLWLVQTWIYLALIALKMRNDRNQIFSAEMKYK